MGIKFHCPNGHKLNVKSFLSGKKAICPKCGVKVVVPGETNLTDNLAAPISTAEHGEHAPTSPEIQGALSAASVPTSTVPAADALATNSSSPAATANLANPAPLANTGMPVTASQTRDAIDEAPSAVWYVRPPSGGQFGPAPADTMRAWLADGRVTANSLVWRSGWPQWQSALAAFPQLAAAPVSMPQTMSPSYAPGGGFASPYPQAGAISPMAAPLASSPYSGAATIPMGQIPVGQPALGQGPLGQTAGAAPIGSFVAAGDEAITRRRRRRKANDTTVIVSAILIVLTLVLVVILVIVLTRDSEHPATDSGATKSPAASKKSPPPPAKKQKTDEDEI